MVEALLCMELKPCSSLHHAGICNGTSQCTVYPNRPISQILQCITQISHNAVFYNRNMGLVDRGNCATGLLIWKQVWLGYVVSYWRYTGAYLPISCRVTAPVLVQSYECPTVNEITLKDIGKIPWFQITTQLNRNCTHYCWDVPQKTYWDYCADTLPPV